MPNKEPQENLAAMAQALEGQPVVDPVSGKPLPTDSSQTSAPASGNPGTAQVEEAPAGEGTGTPGATEEPPAQGTLETPEEPVPTDEELVLTEAEQEAAERLGAFLEQAREEARREVQGAFDKRFGQYKEQTQTQIKTLQEQVRAAQEVGLSDADKEELHKRWAYEDKQKDLDEREALLDAQYKDIMVLSLVHEYGPYGVTEEELAGFDDPDEMESHCKDKAIAFLQSGRSPAPKAGPPAPAPAAVKPAPVGAKAPVDLGGNPPPPEPLKPNTGTGPEAMLENFGQLKVERVKVG